MISMSHTIAERLQKTLTRIEKATTQYGRQRDEVQLIAVSKTQTADSLRTAYSLGQRHFGENYLQEALDKMTRLSDCNITWHFIGSIQSNKTKIIAEKFNWVHSIDRLKIAQRLNNARPEDLEPLNVCLQVNISEENTKSGINASDIHELAHQVATLPKLRLRGLMALPAAYENFEQQRTSFATLKQQFDELKQSGLPLDTLSMGMSNDLEAAIAEGATLVRIGSAIFGPRIKKPLDAGTI